jgi:hypothetical protein
LNPAADFPAFPVFPTISVPGGTPDQTVPNGGTLSLPPGTYGRLALGKDATVNFTGSGTYTFKSIEAGLSSHLNFAQDDVILRVEEWMHVSEYSQFNSDGRLNVVIYVAGTDGKYGGLNGNRDGVTANSPAAFGFDGDGPFIACFIYTPNGTMNLRGHLTSVSQFFGKDFQQVSTIAITMVHPQQICFNVVPVQCTFISRISCGAATGNKLVVNGDLLTPSAGFDKLAIWKESTNISAGTPDISADVLMQKGADPTTGFTVVGLGVGDVLTTNASTPFGLAAGNYYVGLIGAATGTPPVTQSFYVYTGQRLVIDGAGNCSVIK